MDRAHRRLTGRAQPCVSLPFVIFCRLLSWYCRGTAVRVPAFRHLLPPFVVVLPWYSRACPRAFPPVSDSRHQSRNTEMTNPCLMRPACHVCGSVPSLTHATNPAQSIAQPPPPPPPLRPPAAQKSRTAVRAAAPQGKAGFLAIKQCLSRSRKRGRGVLAQTPAEHRTQRRQSLAERQRKYKDRQRRP